MKQLFLGSLGFFSLLFVYTKLAGPIPFSVTSLVTQKSESFSVTGEGKVTAAPDVAVVQLGVQSEGSSVKAAQEALNNKINQVSQAVKKLGIDAKDIQTESYNIQPNYDFTPSNQRISGYQASSFLTVKIREIDKVNNVIDAATKAGANQVSGLNFTLDDPSRAQNEARSKAVADARRKAEDAARIAGFKLGKIINYQESFGGEPRPIMMMEKAQVSRDATPTQIEPGTNEVVVTVTLSFEIR